MTGCEKGPVYTVFWEGSRVIGVIAVIFVVIFGFWSLIALTIPGARSPIELLGVRPVENCSAFVNSDFVVDCSMPHCPAGCVSDGTGGEIDQCKVDDDCPGNLPCTNGLCKGKLPDVTPPFNPGPTF